MNNIIEKCKEYIKEIFQNEFSGHDYWHTIRVFKTATTIAKKEKADLSIVQLASLLHDVDDAKISPTTTEHKDNAVFFMKENSIDEIIINKVLTIIDEISFVGTDSKVPSTIEGMCVQDADRLDAIGAIGIARCFTFGGNHNRVLYDPEIKPNLNMNKEEYRKNVSTTLNHFYEKLFLLKDMMNTDSAKDIAENRHQIMIDYVEEFLAEWEGEK